MNFDHISCRSFEQIKTTSISLL